jgi:hypothetical protein
MIVSSRVFFLFVIYWKYDYIDAACAGLVSFRLFNIMTDGMPLENKNEIEHPHFCSSSLPGDSSFDQPLHSCLTPTIIIIINSSRHK